MSEIVLAPPDSLAQEPTVNGLLAPDLVASLFRAEIRRRKINKLFVAADRLGDLDEPLFVVEIQRESDAVRI